MSISMTGAKLRLALLIVLAIGLVAYAKLIRQSAVGSHSTAATIVAEEATDNLEVELVTLRPEGFEPLQIIRPKGPFVLLVDDRTGKEGSSLRLQRLKGESLRELNTNRRKSEWHDLINLPPGDYLLSDAENPERRCQITLQP